MLSPYGEPAPQQTTKVVPPSEVEQAILLQNGFSLDILIGEGSYANVRRARHNVNKNPLAVKIIKKDKAPDDFLKRFLPRELEIMCKIKHPNIIHLYHVLDLPNHVYIFMELAEGGDLLDYIKGLWGLIEQTNGPMSEKMARRAFGQLVSALRYCHNLNIAHRDLKCENILLDQYLNTKLTDFGFSRICTDGTNRRVLSETYCGSSAYAAPEVLQGIPYNPKMYDIWSVGVILYIMVCGSMPFDDSNLAKMLKAIVTKPVTYPSRMSFKISAECKELLRHILTADITRRATMEQIRRSAWLEVVPSTVPNNQLATAME